MSEEDIGKVFLVAFPWDWTIAGRFKGYRGTAMIFEEAGYFTRTGATFDVLCSEGFTPETQFHNKGDGILRTRTDFNLIKEWKAAWPQRNYR